MEVLFHWQKSLIILLSYTERASRSIRCFFHVVSAYSILSLNTERSCSGLNVIFSDSDEHHPAATWHFSDLATSTNATTHLLTLRMMLPQLLFDTT